MKKHLKEYLQALGQAFFLENAAFGAILLLLFLAFNPYYFACGGLASLIGYAYSTRPRTPRTLRDTGLITLNGLFFGVAMAGLFKPSPSPALCLLVGAATLPLVTQAAHEVFQHWKLSPFIFPYILAVWVIWLSAGGLVLDLQREAWPMTFISLPPAQPGWNLEARLVWSALESMGRLFFLPSAAFGLALLALITAFSLRRACFFFVGTLVASIAAGLLAGAGHAWEHGFYSYSAGLIGLGLASFEEKFSVRTILLFCFVSAILTMSTDQFLRGLNLPELSLPYVLTMWLALLSRSPRLSVAWEPRRGRAAEAARLFASPAILSPPAIAIAPVEPSVAPEEEKVA